MTNKALVDARKAKGYSQQEVADFLQIRKSTVCNWEKGRSFPRMKEAIALTKLLNKTIEELFYDVVIILVEEANYSFIQKNTL